MTRVISVPASRGTYDILIGEGLLERNPFLLSDKSRRALFISNETVGPLYAQSIATTYQQPYLELPDGEQHKTVTNWEKVIHTALEYGLDRHSVMVGIGGGVVTDLVGFAASTFMRGIDYISVPTTLLAMVDASVGGKTGINIPMGKNLIGSFYAPSRVVMDVSTLATLPEREYRAGLAEVVKYALVLDADFMVWLEKNISPIQIRQPNVLLDLVERCCQLKREIVREDERETGRRALLNLGHTVGHALEAATGYTALLHGEAVAIGLIAELSVAELTLSVSLPIERVRRLLKAFGLPTAWNGEVSKLVPFMYKDKKNHGGDVYFVLCEEIGRATCRPVPLDDNTLHAIEQAIQPS